MYLSNVNHFELIHVYLSEIEENEKVRLPHAIRVAAVDRRDPVVRYLGLQVPASDHSPTVLANDLHYFADIKFDLEIRDEDKFLIRL